MKTNQKTNEKSGDSIFPTVFKVVNPEKVLIEMIPVEGGTFMMGATAEQGNAADDDEYPVHKVTVSSFAIGKYPVTQALWIAVMGKCPPYVTGAPNCLVADKFNLESYKNEEAGKPAVGKMRIGGMMKHKNQPV